MCSHLLIIGGGQEVHQLHRATWEGEAGEGDAPLARHRGACRHRKVPGGARRSHLRRGGAEGPLPVAHQLDFLQCSTGRQKRASWALCRAAAAGLSLPNFESQARSSCAPHLARKRGRRSHILCGQEQGSRGWVQFKHWLKGSKR